MPKARTRFFVEKKPRGGGRQPLQDGFGVHDDPAANKIQVDAGHKKTKRLVAYGTGFMQPCDQLLGEMKRYLRKRYIQWIMEEAPK